MRLERLGAGAIGIVYKAYDPLLVARSRSRSYVRMDGRRSCVWWKRRRRVAQLSHPNGVGVYDVVVLAEHVVLAMEYVPGQTPACLRFSDSLTGHPSA